MNKSPCMGCNDRKEKCHSDCKRYKDFKIEIENINKQRQKVRQNESLNFMPKKY